MKITNAINAVKKIRIIMIRIISFKKINECKLLQMNYLIRFNSYNFKQRIKLYSRCKIEKSNHVNITYS